MSLPWTHSRFWVAALWALAVGALAGGLHWGLDGFDRQARRETMWLLPASPFDSSQRDAIAKQIKAAPGVSWARWRSPADLVKKINAAGAGRQIAGFLPDESNWLPWSLEIAWSEPLDRTSAMGTFQSARQKEDQWDLIFWDGARLNRLADRAESLKIFMGFALVLTFLMGAVALARIPGLEETGALWIAALALMGAAGPLALWGAANAAGFDVGAGTLGVGAGAGAVLAAATPLLRAPKHKTPAPGGRPVKKRIDTSA